jgi:hypothetical protein
MPQDVYEKDVIRKGDLTLTFFSGIAVVRLPCGAHLYCNVPDRKWVNMNAQAWAKTSIDLKRTDP